MSIRNLYLSILLRLGFVTVLGVLHLTFSGAQAEKEVAARQDYHSLESLDSMNWQTGCSLGIKFIVVD